MLEDLTYPEQSEAGLQKVLYSVWIDAYIKGLLDGSAKKDPNSLDNPYDNYD